MAYRGELIECALCRIGLSFGTLLSLIALVLGLRALIRSGVMALRQYTLCLGCCDVHCFRLHRKCYLNQPMRRTADSSPITAVSFDPLARCASAIQIVRPLESVAESNRSSNVLR